VLQARARLSHTLLGHEYSYVSSTVSALLYPILALARDHSFNDLLSQMLPIIDLDIYRSQPLESPAVVLECTKVSV